MYLGRNCEIKTVVDPKIIKIRWAEATRPIRTINHVLMIPSRSARVLLALALYIGIGTGAVQGQKLLDFTKRLFFQSDPMGTGVTYGKLREPVFPVQRSPLELTIQSIQAISVGAQRSFVVDVLLRNTGERRPIWFQRRWTQSASRFCAETVEDACFSSKQSLFSVTHK